MAGSPKSGAKRCRDCGMVKPVSEFWRRKQSPDGLSLYCKECFGLRNAASYRGRLAVQGREARPYRRYSAVPVGMKYCPTCGETKALSDFGRNRANKSGVADYCKPCHNKVMAANKQKNHGSERSYLLKRRYGLTAEDVAERQMLQLRRCLICLKEGALHVDHDHASGKFRGLLCFSCNNGLGQFKDDPDMLRKAADYLEGAEIVAEPVVLEVLAADEAAAEPSAEQRLRRHYKLSTRYGVGLDEVERMIAEQGGVCAICRSAAPRDVDHDHETGEVRGILCSPCNTGMGLFKDNPRHLRDAAAYLEGTAADREVYQMSRFVQVFAGHAPGLRPQASRLEGLMAEMIKEFGAN